MRIVPVAISVVLPLAVAGTAPASPSQPRGPAIEDAAVKLLHVDPATGRWQPRGGWLTARLAPGQPLRVAILDARGEPVIWNTWRARPRYRGVWARAEGIARWSTAAPAEQVLAPGRYTIEVSYGVEPVWRTRFRVKAVAFGGAMRTFVDGPWRARAQLELDPGDAPARLCFWLSGGTDARWYAPASGRRSLALRGEVRAGDAVLLSAAALPEETVVLTPGAIVRACKSLGPSSKLRAALERRDGVYRVRALAGELERYYAVAEVRVAVQNGRLTSRERGQRVRLSEVNTAAGAIPGYEAIRRLVRR